MTDEPATVRAGFVVLIGVPSVRSVIDDSHGAAWPIKVGGIQLERGIHT